MQNVNSFLGSWVASFFMDQKMSGGFLLCAFIPIKIYYNVEANKAQILSDNKNKLGIYMFQNSINGKRYLGSELRRLRQII